MVVNPQRIRELKAGAISAGPVVYWMSRDQRLADNWALLYAQQVALERKTGLAIVFCLAPDFLDATIRQYEFMLKGLEQIASQSRKHDIPFILLTGNPELEVPRFAARNDIGLLVCDFMPLRVNRRWKDQVMRRIKVPLHEVDAHNIVPCWVTSDKQEYAAYTLRPKLHKLLPEFLNNFPKLKKHPFAWQASLPDIDWQQARLSLSVDRSVAASMLFEAGESAATRVADRFLKQRLRAYDSERNDPNVDGQSGLSPYLHFGQLAAQRVALDAQRYDRHLPALEAFLEELIVRRELADNFCFYNADYDAFEGFSSWARVTLDDHRGDLRPYLYTLKQFESAETDDALWNAAQLEMVQTGKMHGYMRMYWAKKILEWTALPEQAMEIAIYLNDLYELDGRDPNGYTGIAWSIGGVHDRPWFERGIFGKVRYMSYSGCERKFDAKKYIARHKAAGSKARD